MTFGHPNLVQTVEQENALLKMVGESGGVIAIDTETTGVGWEDYPRLVQFGVADTGWAVPAENVALIRTVLDATTSHIYHNAGFDIRMLVQLGIDAEDLWLKAHDTYILAHLDQPDQILRLKTLGETYLGVPPEEQDTLKVSMRKGKWTWATIPLDHPDYVAYAIQDTMLTYRLYRRLMDKLSPTDQLIADEEMEVSRLCWNMEQKGVLIDQDYRDGLSVEWTDKLMNIKAWMSDRGVLNPNSPRQIAIALQNQGWKPKEFTETGQVKTDKAILAKLSGEYELAEKLLEHRHYTKFLASYVDACVPDIAGRVHANIRSLRAKTGRMSISSPPLQQLPSHEASVRKMFIAKPGFVIAAADFSQMELRIAAAMSEEPAMIQAFVEGLDLHTVTAQTLFGVEKPTDRQRSLAKNCGLGVLYGAGYKKIATMSGVSEPIAKNLLDGFWAAYPVLAAWDIVNTKNAVKRWPIISLAGRKLAPHSPHAATNAIVQGSAADLFKQSLMGLEQAELADYILLPVHDEVLLELPVDKAEELLLQYKSVMETTLMGVPIVVDTKVCGPSWGAAYE